MTPVSTHTDFRRIEAVESFLKHEACHGQRDILLSPNQLAAINGLIEREKDVGPLAGIVVWATYCAERIAHRGEGNFNAALQYLDIAVNARGSIHHMKPWAPGSSSGSQDRIQESSLRVLRSMAQSGDYHSMRGVFELLDQMDNQPSREMDALRDVFIANAPRPMSDQEVKDLHEAVRAANPHLRERG